MHHLASPPIRWRPWGGWLIAACFTLPQTLIGPAIAEEHELKRVLREIDQVKFEAETTEILPRYCLPQLQPTKKPTRDRIYALQERLRDLLRRIAEIKTRYMAAGQTAIGTSYRTGFPPIDGLRPMTPQGAENNAYWGKAYGIAEAAERVIEQKKTSLASKPEVDCSKPTPRGPAVRPPAATTPAAQPGGPVPVGGPTGSPFIPGRGHLEGLNPPGVSGDGYVVRLPQRFCSLAEKEAMQAMFDAADARARAKAAEWEAYARQVEARKLELMKGGLEEHWQRSLDYEANKARRIGEDYLGYVAANATGRSLVASMPVVDCEKAMRQEAEKARERLGGGGIEPTPPPESILDEIDPPFPQGGGKCVLPTNELEAPARTLQGHPFSTTTKLSGRAFFGTEFGGIGTSSTLEAPPATAGAGSFSTTTKLKGEVVWGTPSCSGQGTGTQSPQSPDDPSFTGKDLLETWINRMRLESGRKELPILPEDQTSRVLQEYIGNLAAPILKGAPCDHDQALWQDLQTRGQGYGLEPRSELLTCVRPKGVAWESTVAEQWRKSPIHFTIILKDADHLSCHRSQLGDKELGVCITWRGSNQAQSTAPAPTRPSSTNGCDTSLLSRYVFLPACIKANQTEQPN